MTTSTTILGSGNMARGIGTRVVAAGGDLQILDRDPARAEALTKEIGGAHGRLGDPVTGQVVVLALPYDAVASVLAEHGDALAGRIVVDITNPVDMTTFAGLVTPADSSAAQEIAKQLPAGTPVVKAFNTTFAGPLVTGTVAQTPLDVLIAGDDEAAKGTVSELVAASGLRPIDVGPLAQAHWLEGIGFLHIGLQLRRGTGFATAVALIGG
jgi:NADPH-dependent F420 reductase